MSPMVVKQAVRVAAALLLAGVSLALPVVSWAEEGRVSTPEERQKFLDGVKRLEQTPLGDEADAFRKWAIEWLSDVKDISVNIGTGITIIMDIPEEHVAHTPVAAQFILATAVNVIRHKDEKVDPIDRDVEALQSCLAVYAALLKDHPERKLDLMEELKKLNDEGKLKDYVRKREAEEAVIEKKAE